MILAARRALKGRLTNRDTPIPIEGSLGAGLDDLLLAMREAIASVAKPRLARQHRQTHT